MSTIILVHGAFHTGECWWRLTPLLSEKGFEIRTPTLRGQSGHDHHPWFVTLNGYASDIITAAERADGPSILLGHSLAGLAISVAAERRPDLFSTLIYLSAVVPKLGRSTLKDVLAADAGHAGKFKFQSAATFPADQAADFFYNECSPDVQAKAISLLSPQPIRPMFGVLKSTEGRFGSIPKHYIECTNDRVSSLAHQRRMQRHLRFETVQTLETDHSPFLSDPAALTAAIEQVAFANRI